MKKINKAISLALALFLALGWCIAFPSYAANEEVLGELAAVGQDAEIFARVFKNDFTKAVYVAKTGETTPFYTINAGAVFLTEHGYIDDHVGEAVTLPMFGGEEFPHNPLSIQFDSLEKWDEEVLNYFTSDFLGLVRAVLGLIPPLIQEHNGKTYCATINDYCFFYINWDSAVLTQLSEEHAEITAEILTATDGEMYAYGTVEFEKTERGWRVCGGSYFDFEYLGEDDALSRTPPVAIDPPKTGEHTGLYALIFTLAVLPLGVFAIGAFKKRRRGAV